MLQGLLQNGPSRQCLRLSGVPGRGGTLPPKVAYNKKALPLFASAVPDRFAQRAALELAPVLSAAYE